MEAPSLLGQAVSHHKQQQQQESSTLLSNTLWLDVFLVERCLSPSDALLTLGTIAKRLNAHFCASHYPWHSGGDGVVFGMHYSSCSSSDNTARNIPHLRAQINYGASVQDEWKAIAILLQASTTTTILTNCAVRCWDVDDGQVLLIQLADILPDWVDEIGPEQCEHRCWIYQKNVHLIAPPHNASTLSRALNCLEDGHSQARVEFLPILRDNMMVDSSNHRAALLLPRSVARGLQGHPTWIPILAHAFLNHCRNEPTKTATTIPTDDWVWTVQPFPPSIYAMLCHVPSPHWNDPAPLWISTPETKRLHQQFGNCDSTPHLQHGLAIGMRLLNGLHHSTMQKTSKETCCWSFEQHVVHNWGRLAQSLGVHSWLQNLYTAGPNQASSKQCQDLLDCLVFDPELVQHPLPRSLGLDTYWPDRLRSVLCGTTRENSPNDIVDRIPRPDQVDDTGWMTITDDDMVQAATTATGRTDSKSHSNTDSQSKDNDVLNDMVRSVQTFMTSSSSAQGVEPSTTATTRSLDPIDPALFLRTLHAALKCDTAAELQSILQAAATTNDPFFSQDDYNLMEPDNDGTDSDDDERMLDNNDDEVNLKHLMQAMDAELGQSGTQSRALDGIDNATCTDDDDVISEPAHVLSNLLKSLDTSEGAPGPVRNLLGEMGHSFC